MELEKTTLCLQRVRHKHKSESRHIERCETNRQRYDETEKGIRETVFLDYVFPLPYPTPLPFNQIAMQGCMIVALLILKYDTIKQANV